MPRQESLADNPLLFGDNPLLFRVCNFCAAAAISGRKRGKTVAFPICCDLVHHGTNKVIACPNPYSLVCETALSPE
jgi:hypothetical protein